MITVPVLLFNSLVPSLIGHGVEIQPHLLMYLDTYRKPLENNRMPKKTSLQYNQHFIFLVNAVSDGVDRRSYHQQQQESK